MAELKDDEIPNVEALGRQIIEESKNKKQQIIRNQLFNN
ncbi:MAG: hypothetical protein Ct9H300mP3_05030 [Gammaproteobacteria bacterium]|nr:MAG: hypothetical protein Ct9H300mP3_05030 [Gammaproteobacteria bacterium]